ncbi:MAG: TrbG/VirB9 family P-type conjugative transfer protein [Candidatus Eremiobacteraeota bacterium]|nr:TrbG/VirB9 family P-type conjugative transfer protein [Candidatus Eremiobacteraeota bacterium]
MTHSIPLAALAGAVAATCASAAAQNAPTAQAAPVAAAPAAPRYVGSDGVLRFPFPGPEPTVTCRPLFVCDVSLQPGESILNIGAGDTARWVIAAAQSGPGGNTPHVFIKPTEADLRTNLIVTTTKHVYYVRLVSAGAVVNPRIGFYYPDEEAQAALDRQREAQRQQAEHASDLPLVPPDRLDTAYNVSGERSLFPSKVYNDGLHTYVEYRTLPSDLPVVFGIALDGTNQIVNYRLKDNVFIVDGTPSGVDLVLNAGTGRHGRGERRVYIRHK